MSLSGRPGMLLLAWDTALLAIVYQSYQCVYYVFENLQMSLWVMVTATIAVIAITILHFLYRRIKIPDIRIPELEENRQLRFRKRDKVRFFATKVLRKGKDAASRLQRQASAIKEGVSIPEYSRSGRRLRKRERMLILAKKQSHIRNSLPTCDQMKEGRFHPLIFSSLMFHVKQDPPKLLKKELPTSMLEPDILNEEQKPDLPEEVMYLLQSVKVFGHFEKGIFLQLCRHMEILKVEKDKYLFRIGDPDEYMYVIQDGQINLYISDDGLEVKLSESTAGESIHSLLSILDVLTGHSAPYKTVFARAVEDSTVIRLPVKAFNVAFENRKDALVQMVQVIMTRMQRVTFLALHNCLGLSQELLNPVKNGNGGRLSIHKLCQSQDSLGSLLSQHSQESDESATDILKTDTDQTDAAVLQNERPIVKESLPKVKSDPVLQESKAKQLRFGEIVTVFDDNDNIFQRQASLPNTGSKKHILDEKASLEEFEDQLSYQYIHRDSTTSISSGETPGRWSSNRPQESWEERKSVTELNEPEILDLVVQDLMIVFGIEDEEILKEKVVLLQVPEGYELIQEGEQDVSLYFVVTGSLCIYQAILQHDPCADHNVTLFHAFPGMLTGQLAVLTGEPSFFSVRADNNSVIALLKRKDFYSIMRKYPRMVLNTAHTVVQRVSRFTRQIDFALDWLMVEAGKAVYKQGTTSDCMYIILHGRLRSVHEIHSTGKKELVSEFGRGEMVGMMEALRGTSRAVSMHAVRDTELAKIPEGLLKHIRRHHPGVVSHLVSLVSEKLLGSMMTTRPTYRNHPGELLSHKQQMAEETKFAYGDVSNHLANLSTVAVLPVNRGVPVEKFTMELEHALSAICDQVLHLTSDNIKNRLGQSALDSAHEYRLSGWLAQQEDLHRIVLYQADDHMSLWTQRCIRQSDAILIVANGDGEPNVGELEQELENYSIRALKVLVLLHRPEVSQPTRTVEWLNMRGWLTEHLHIKGSKRLFARTTKSKLPQYRERLRQREVDRFSDFSRLARFLTGTSVALVLGGGGARGISQLGIIKALLESGVPIDMVGGTSIGAFVGALWAGHRDMAIVRSQTATFSTGMGSFMPKLFDLTYPITSMFSGASFNRAIQAVFKETQIEDLWLPYYTITTDITSPKMRVHTDGSLWRYVRASMSLSGYLPPICDPKDGHLLMDGGYINNVPGDVARSRGACRVIAVDVGAAITSDFTDYGDHLSGWWVLWKKWTGRWTGHIKVPDMNEIQQRLSYISCHYLMDLVVNSNYCTYLRPPVNKYSTMDFAKWKDLLELGYKYGREVCTEEWGDEFWRELHQFGSPDQHRSSVDKVDGRKSLRNKTSLANMRANASFTDLSEILRKKSNAEEAYFLASGTEFSDLEFEIGYESSPECGSSKMYLERVESEPLSEPDEIVSDMDGAISSKFHDESDEEDLSSDDEIVSMRRFSSQNVLSTSFR
uniref:patatin-like phospholipase domain-containing protein 7 isoform X3 n=1 Tax=Styela clava TaxID=7725 RepID=UPI00193ADB4A|nr:patatin-like phospholipase domain-containing protein 7 isoform X3 [Styela clava]